MSKEELITFEGVVQEVLPDSFYKVKLNENEHIIIAYASGKIRKNKIKIIEGDNVSIEISPYDLTKGRITFRTK